MESGVQIEYGVQFFDHLTGWGSNGDWGSNGEWGSIRENTVYIVDYNDDNEMILMA